MKLLLATAAAFFLLNAPAFAGLKSLTDADLNRITGEANTYIAGAGSTMDLESSNSNNLVQIGMSQWSDNHSADTSNHKGANDQSGTNSQVQAHVVAETNAIAWGSVAQSVLHNVGTTTLTGPEVNRAYSVFVAGGF